VEIMIKKLVVRSFKTLENVEVELGQVNVFIGANGSGKSNLLEAIGVLSAAASGKVDDQTLLQRGVRPGVPKLYKSSFKGATEPPHIYLGTESISDSYAVSLQNPIEDPHPAWFYETEVLESDSARVFDRSTDTKFKPDPEQGVAALYVIDPAIRQSARDFLKLLQNFVIYSPTTSVLRGMSPETQPRKPVGLSGGSLAEAVSELLMQRWKNEQDNRENPQLNQVIDDAHGLIDWADEFGSAMARNLPLSRSAAAMPVVVRFVDRFMCEGRNELSGYDASEGSLFVLFLAVLAAHPNAPQVCAVDNADHGINPRLARALMKCLCDWYTTGAPGRQILLTTHNPLVLDGLPLQDDRIRLFTVSRTETGRTSVRRIEVTPGMMKKAQEGWSLSRLWVMGHLGGVPDV